MGRKSPSPAGHHPLWLLMLFQLIRSILNVTLRFHQFDLIHVLAVTPALASTFIKIVDKHVETLASFKNSPSKSGL